MSAGPRAHPRRPNHVAAARALPALALATALVGRPAAAGDDLRPRTPVIHLDESCLTVIDRLATPRVRLDFTFPFEDTCVTGEAAPRLQLFALCRPPRAHEQLPQWINREDIAYTESLGMALPTLPAEAVLVESPEWSGCWAPIVADDARLPLTCETARAGVEWDLAGLAPGIWVVAGYTFHPPQNLWSPRWGVFKIVEGAAEDAPPVAAIANRAGFIYADETIELAACASAMPGSTLTFEYAIDAETPVWEVAAADLPVEGPIVVAPWDPPASAEARDVRLRARIVDPLARAQIVEATEMQAALAVPLPAGGSGGPPTPPPIDDTCRDDPTPLQVVCPSGRGSTGGDGSSTGAPGEEGEGPSGGCVCALAPSKGRGAPLLGPLLVLVARRRRPTCR